MVKTAEWQVKVRDIGEKLVESLQNTIYYIDEKLEKSFIILFSKKPTQEEPSDIKDNQEKVGLTEDQYQSGEQSEIGESGDDDGDDVKCLEYTDEGRILQKDSTLKRVDSGSDEENISATEDSLSENKVSQHIEFQNRRMRKAVFGNELDLGNFEVSRRFCTEIKLDVAREDAGDLIFGSRKKAIYLFLYMETIMLLDIQLEDCDEGSMVWWLWIAYLGAIGSSMYNGRFTCGLLYVGETKKEKRGA